MKHLKHLLYGTLLAALFVSLVMLTGCGEQKKKSSEYITPAISGINGNGTLTLSFDTAGLTADIMEKKQLTEREKETLSDLLSGIEKDYILSKSTGLSNGDTVTITGGLDKELLKNFGILFENDSVSLTVDGLVDQRELSISDYYNVAFSGFDGDGYAYLSMDQGKLLEDITAQAVKLYPNEDEDTISYQMWNCLNTLTLSQYSFDGLSLGDTIRASVSMDDTTIEKYGVVFDASDIEFPVTDLAPVETIALGDYLTITFDGFDTFGTARAELDNDRLTEDLQTLLQNDGRSAYGLAYEDTDYLNQAAVLAEKVESYWSSAFYTELSATENLTNGDTVKVMSVESSLHNTADYSEETSGYGEISLAGYGLTMLGGAAEKEVSELPETVQMDLSPYLSVVYEGFDGQGIAKIAYDDETFQNDIDALIISQKPELAEPDAVFTYLGAYDVLHYSLSADVSELTGLSNEDKLVITPTLTDDRISEYGILLEASEIETDVAGLTPVIELDLSEYIDMQLTGYDGAGHLNVVLSDSLNESLTAILEELQRGAYGMISEDSDLENEANILADKVRDCWQNDFVVTVSKDSGIANGDTITISAVPSEAACDNDQFTVSDNSLRINQYGLWMHGFEKDYTIGDETALTAPQEIDLADSVTVTFAGISPYVTVTIEKDTEVPYYNQTGLVDLPSSEEIQAENGDIYTRKLTHNDEELLEMGYVVTGDTIECEITGLETWTLDPEDTDQEALRTLTDAATELAANEPSWQSENIRPALTEDAGWIIWEDITSVNDEIRYASETENSHYHNMLAWSGHYNIPVRNLDRSVTWKEMTYIVWVQDVRKDADGALVSDNGLSIALYYDSAQATDELAAKFTDAMGEGTGISLILTETEEPEKVLSVEMAEATPLSEEKYISASAPAIAEAVGDPIVVDGHAYYRFDQIGEKWYTWQEAKDFCEETGGHLVTITTYKELMAVKYLLRESPASEYWMGGTDEDFEGSWKWITGEAFVGPNWNDSQPDNYADNDDGCENYLTIYPDGTWNDQSTKDEGIGFILEIEPEATDTDAADALEAAEAAVPLADLTPVGSWNQEFWDSASDPYGNVYFDLIAYNAGERGMNEYDLDGAYEKLSFTVSTVNDAASDAVLEFVVWGDDTLLYALYDYSRAQAPVTVELDVSGVNRLNIQTNARKGEGWMLLNNAYLTPAGAADGANDADDADDTEGAESADDKTTADGTFVTKFLSDLRVLSSNEVTFYTTLGVPVDITGRIYRDYITFNSANNPEVTFLIDTVGQDAVLRADLAMRSIPYGDSGTIIVEFLKDGETVGEYQIDQHTGCAPVELDVSDAVTLTIRVHNQEEERRNELALIGNIRLTAEDGEAADDAADGAAEEASAAKFIFPEFETLDEEYTDKAAASITCDDVRYFRYDQPMTYKEAQDFCKEAGCTLADPQTEEQQRAIDILMNRSISRYTYWTAQNDTIDEAREEGSPDPTGGFIMQQTADTSARPDNGQNLMELETLDSRSTQITESSYTDYSSGMKHFSSSSLQLNTGEQAYAVWDLQGKYSLLTAEILKSRNNSLNSFCTLAIFGDGKLLYSQEDLRIGIDPIIIACDVSGVSELSIMTSANEESIFILFRPMLYPAGAGSTAAGSDRLTALTQVDSAAMDLQPTLLSDNAGDLHAGAIRLNAGENGFVLYNLNKQYTQVTLTAAAGAETVAYKDRTIRVLVDDTVVYEAAVSGKYWQPEVITLDVTGAGTLRIETENGTDDTARDIIYLVDDILE